ncbi:hypothetical protein NUH88_19170 [Nisaea acidiphila]|uniref:Aggregation factor core n=1 Tax=Nisaea acidiphila TaxID=1862145 RepID=A0A9J7AT51_9PROT|nr:hypothetical protein [Nisaea acidiphila]UUX49508.1 hypothetical protein NUH88_19170 [Nisaea acidiphila]
MHALLPVLLLASAPAAAAEDLSVTFTEASPVDLIIVENRSTCDLYDFGLQIDLRSSAAGLVFDISEGGAGASVYQPFELLEGREAVRSFAPVRDGDRVASILFGTLEAGQRVIFTVDVDDTSAESAWGQTVIDGAEIAGATIVITTVGEEPSTAFFLPDGRATAKLRGCGPVS